ncbi:MAG: Rrf2 family transcriptional regulator [Gemmataceae bacterium]|nr:Rrf2 family transcriptional regulator [Gemmataceae bacterium]
MKLTRASAYALHAVAFMAGQKSDKPIASHKIARKRKIPDRFLLKVLKPLVSHKILESTKGPTGGYQLARPANEITMLEVIEAAENGPLRGDAPTNKKNPSSQLDKRLKQICGKATDALREQLSKIKVSELITRD